MTHYHNTNNLRGDELKDSEKRAENQTVWVKGFFDRNQYTPHTPSAVKRAYDKANGTGHLNQGTGVLITSIRRAMSDLTKGKNAHLRIADIPNTKSPRGGREGYWERNLPMEKGEQSDMFGASAVKPRQDTYGGL